MPSTLRRCLQAVALSALCAAPLHAATINLFTASGSYNVGQSFNVDFRIGGLSGAPGQSLSGFDLNVLFDSSLLQLTGYGFTDPASNRNELDLPEPGSFGFFGEASANAGVIDAFGISGNSAAVLDAGQADEFRFLTLTFQALAASATTAIQVDLNDPNLLFLNSDAGDLATGFGAARVAFAIAPGSTQVPEPGSLALLLAGAAGMLLIGRRRSHASTAALAMALAATAGSASAQQPVVSNEPPAATAQAPKAVDAVIVAVKGRRAQIKLSNGTVQWVSVAGPIAQDQVGKRISGKIAPRGDAIMLFDPVIAN
ncbi:cohesin domain-containing protein [Massilia sp. METH4]|uniref:cohesin domain-containing protein n=1 Tax=Massilia sp. METH4 TaxID=3123041 RepID=UPI0030CE932E